jgi:hypothetical protein
MILLVICTVLPKCLGTCDCVMSRFANRAVAGAKGQLVREGLPVGKDTACHGEGQQGAVQERPEAESHWRASPGSWLHDGPRPEGAAANEELGREVWLVRNFPRVQSDVDARYARKYSLLRGYGIRDGPVGTAASCGLRQSEMGFTSCQGQRFLFSPCTETLWKLPASYPNETSTLG